MENFTLLDFFAASIPEELCMALFAYAILGKYQDVKYTKVILTGFITAVTCAAIMITLYPNLVLLLILQMASFAIIIYFLYQTNIIEAFSSSLLTFIIILIIQSVTVTLGLAITGHNNQEYADSEIGKILVAIPEYLIVSLLSIVVIKKRLHIFRFKKKNIKEFLTDKIRFVVLQLTFAFSIVIVNFRIFLYNVSILTNDTDRALIIINFSVILIFTFLSIRSAFKMSESIQREEEFKRMLDNKEMFQNIDYLCKLMDTMDYDEANQLLKSMKVEIGQGLQKVPE